MSLLAVIFLFAFGVLVRASLVYWMWGFLAVQIGLPHLDLPGAIVLILLVQVLTRYTPPSTIRGKMKEFELTRAGKL